MILIIIIAIIAIIIATVLRFRSSIYDAIIVAMTKSWYAAYLEQVPPNTRILDVGIGTGAALIANKDVILSKKLIIVGVDYDHDYIVSCKQNIINAGLQDYITVYHDSIYDFMTSKSPKTMDIKKFDSIFFSGSLMIMPSPSDALIHSISLLSNNKTGTIYTAQTFEKNKNFILEYIKPLLKYITSIDFGQVTYEDDFKHNVNISGLIIRDDINIQASSSLSSSATGSKQRAFRLFCLGTPV